MFNQIREWVGEFLRERISEFMHIRQKMVLLYLGGGVLILFLAFMAVLFIQGHVRSEKEKSAAKELADSFKPLEIPPEDLFLPEEPDFLPEIIPGRFPRNTWTAEDLRPYWTDPLEGKAGLWRDRVEGVVDALMEGVP